MFMPIRKLNEGIRIASLLLEFMIMFTVIMLFSIPPMNNDSFGFFKITHEAYKLDPLSDPLIYLSMIGFALLLASTGRALPNAFSNSGLLTIKPGQ